MDRTWVPSLHVWDWVPNLPLGFTPEHIPWRSFLTSSWSTGHGVWCRCGVPHRGLVKGIPLQFSVGDIYIS
jgi:hypothetical protein